jgi:RNA polymerase-associated protein LEO1
VRMLQVDLARIKPPEGDDLYFLNMPPFLGVKHKSFQPSTYEPPTAPHEARNQTKSEDAAVDGKFSAFSTASTTMFWRRDPKTPNLIQSNTRLVRWSDGSITLQIASQPKDHYRVSTNPLRQGWPKKQGAAGNTQDYDPNRDTHNYLAAPHAVVGVDLQIVSPFDAALKIQPTGDYVDESVLKLQQSLAAATEQHDPIASLRPTRIDPELAKREAERFEKDRIRANRKVEAAQERLITRRDRVIGRAGMGGRIGGAGLSIAGLEDEDGMPGARGSMKAKAAKRRKINRRGEIYSDDEDEDTHRGRREDEYDREDDFLAASDEEPEIYDDDGGDDEVEAEDDDPDVDDLEIEGRETVVNSRTRGEQQGRSRGGRERGSTPKRPVSGDDEGALPQGSPQRGKRRRFIDDDDEDE